MIPVAVGVDADLPDLTARVCDWGELGAAPALLGQWGSVFWARQDSAGRVHVMVSSPRRVLLDAHVALMGLQPTAAAESAGPVAEWLDASAQWPRVAWSVALMQAVAARLRAAGQPLPTAAMPTVGPIPSVWLIATMWATYYPDSTLLSEFFRARTATLPSIGTEWAVSPARRQTSVFTCEALDVRIRAVFAGINETTVTPESNPGVTPDGNATTARGDTSTPSTTSSGLSTEQMIVGGLLLLLLLGGDE